ncbi:MAG: hypothetical protein ABI650_02640 [Dokdonella sp.]
MRLRPILATVLTMAMALPAHAQEHTIRRCIGVNGEPTFTDQPCATIAPRIEVDDLGGVSPSATTQTCATSPEQLRERVIDAFSTGNAIALSGLFLWDGYRGRSSTSHLQDLARLVVEPLISVDVAISTDSAREGSVMHASLIVRSARDLERVPIEAISTFLLSSEGGCSWLVLPD